MDKEQRKSLLIIMAVVFIVIIILVPIIIFSYEDLKGSKDESFPRYSEVEITKKTIKYHFKKVKKSLEKEPYFIKLVATESFDYDSVSTYNYDNLIRDFVYLYEVHNDKYFVQKDETKNIYCLNKGNFYSAFKELYNIDLTDNQSVLFNHYNYLSISGASYCMNFNNASAYYKNYNLIGIKSLEMDGKKVIADLYLYNYYSLFTDDENKLIDNVKTAINESNFDEASNIIINDLNGLVTHKEITFIPNSEGKFFKYTIVSNKKIA